MGGLFMSYSANTEHTPIIFNDHHGESLADANIRIGNITSEITELQIKIQAMYQVMLDQGIDPQVFEDKIAEIMKNRTPASTIPKDSQPCPKCGRQVKKSTVSPLLGRCLYCGKDVSFAPTFLSGNTQEKPAE
jgi:hypothetical protein